MRATVSLACGSSRSNNSSRRGPQKELKGTFTNRLMITTNLCPREKIPTCASATAGSGEVNQRKKKRFEENPNIRLICGGTNGSPNAARRLRIGRETYKPVRRRIDAARIRPVSAWVIKVE